MNMMRALLVVEARADAATVREFVYRVLTESVQWVREHSDAGLPELELWHVEDGQTWLAWTNLESVFARHLRGRHTREFGGASGYERVGRKVIRMLLALREQLPDAEKPNALIMVVDHDGDDTRRPGLEAAGKFAADDLVVVVGVPDKKREAWVLNALGAGDGRDRPDVQALCTKLKFHPLDQAHRLRGEADQNTAARDVKNVLESLCPTEDDELDAIRAADLGHLMARGKETGLTAFLESALSLVPLLDSSATGRSLG